MAFIHNLQIGLRPVKSMIFSPSLFWIFHQFQPEPAEKNEITEQFGFDWIWKLNTFSFNLRIVWEHYIVKTVSSHKKVHFLVMKNRATTQVLFLTQSYKAKAPFRLENLEPPYFVWFFVVVFLPGFEVSWDSAYKRRERNPKATATKGFWRNSLFWR